MANIQEWLRDNVGNIDETREVKFERLKNPFVIRALSEKEVDGLRKRATKRQKVNGQWVTQADENLFADLMITTAVKEPDLQSAELQTSWGCPGRPEEILKSMLKSGEYAALGQEIQDLSGFNDATIDELVDEVKN